MNYVKLCSLILGIEFQVRGVFVYSNNGDLIAGGMQNNVKPYIPTEEISKSTLIQFYAGILVNYYTLF